MVTMIILNLWMVFFFASDEGSDADCESTAFCRGKTYRTVVLSEAKDLAVCLKTQDPSLRSGRQLARNCLSINLRSPSGAGAANYYAKSAGHDFDVEPKAPIIDISGIERNVLVERRILARLYLPQAGDAGQHFQPAQVG